MEIPTRPLVVLALLALAIGALLYAIGIVPWWAVPVVVILAPIAIIAVLWVIFMAVWMASGSH